MNTTGIQLSDTALVDICVLALLSYDHAAFWPTVVADEQKALYKQLAESSNFDPRAHMAKEVKS